LVDAALSLGRATRDVAGRRASTLRALHGAAEVTVAGRERGTIQDMTGPTPYLQFQGTAREALSFYADVFGGATQLHTFADFSRADGPPESVAHGYLIDAPVALFASDVAGEQPGFRAQGLMLSLLGTAAAATMRGWFARLAQDGTVVEDLQKRPWGAFDGQVIDRYGLHWLIGFENDASA